MNDCWFKFKFLSNSLDISKYVNITNKLTKRLSIPISTHDIQEKVNKILYDIKAYRGITIDFSK